jgi:hypothetical protein
MSVLAPTVYARDMTTRLSITLFAIAIAIAGCSKKEGDSTKAASKSGLAWEPINYSEMSATCKKTLACCEELAKQGGAASAEDYNSKCSGPALWKDPDCETDLKSRVSALEAESKPVPAACK